MRFVMCILFCLIAAPVWAELTFLSEVDKAPSIQLTDDQLGVIYTDFAHAGVRSTKSIAPGSGFFYFEGKRLQNAADYGFAVGTSTVPLDNRAGRDDQSLAINVQGSLWSNNSWQGNISSAADTYGIAVDYRGINPIVHVIAANEVDGPGVYQASITLTEVTTDLYIIVWGFNSQGNVRQRINAGDDLGADPYTYDPVQVLTEAYYVPIDGIDELVPGWGVPDPGLNVFPTLTVGAPQTTLLGSTVTLTATANDSEDGNLDAAISWNADGQSGSGASFTFTPSTEGDLSVTPTVSDSSGATVSGTIIVTTIATASIDNDGDGLDYDAELALGTNPSLVDSDGDGLSDGKESVYGANPLLVDTDSDEIDDYREALYGTKPDVDDRDEDYDGDGFSNRDEFAAGSHPLKSNSTPTDGVVLLGNHGPNVTISEDGLTATFATARGATVHAAISQVSVTPGSGWFYFEARRGSEPAAHFGVGVASGTASLENYGGFDDQSLGIHSDGNIYYNGALEETFSDTAITEVYGLAVDYSGANPTVYPVINGDRGAEVLGPVTLNGVTSEVFIMVFGSSGASMTINAGADPTATPFLYSKGHVYEAGYPDAEMMGDGWGPEHAYSGPITNTTQYDPVLLSDVVTPAGDGISLGADQRSCSYSVNLKMAIRANTSMVGQFRYWEAYRDVGPFNIGQGYISGHAFVNHYCCVSNGLDGAPPSMSVNSSANVWRNLVSQTSYDINQTHYGFAVDYTGSRPIVHVIIGDALIHTMNMDDFIMPIYPMLYGNPQGFKRTNTANFGTEPWQYDARTILADNGIDTTQLIMGWGDANDGETPVITGQQRVTTPEETGFTIDLGYLDYNDPDVSDKRGGLTLTVLDGDHYTRSGNTITPVLDYDDRLVVPVRISDGVFTSHDYDLVVEIQPTNDAPVISGQSQALSTAEDTPLQISLDDITVNDVDNDYPSAHTLTLYAGDNYSFDGDVVTPDQDFFGTLTVPVTVNDGDLDSNSFDLTITVTAVNDQPEITQQQALTTPEEQDLTLTLVDLTVSDPDNTYPDAFTLSVGDGDFYSRVGATITPDDDFNGDLSVPVTVNDGALDSEIFDVIITVTPINDPPQITGQSEIKRRRNVVFDLSLDLITVVDPDNTSEELLLSAADGMHYSHQLFTIIPDHDYTGTLTIPITVNDGNADSNSFDLMVDICEPPLIAAQSGATVTCRGDEVTLSVSVTGPGPISYQWYKNGLAIDGANSDHIDFASLILSDAGTYACVATNGCDSESSANISLVVNDPLALLHEPDDLMVCPEDSATFNVTASGSQPITYQWRKNGENISLATSSTFVIDDLQSEDEGLYDCIVTNPCGSLTTTTASLIVDGPLTTHIGAASNAAGLDPITFTGSYSCGLPDVQTQWRDVTRGQLLAENQADLVIDPLPSSTTVYEFAVEDNVRREISASRITLLIPLNNAYLDLNGDGCNDITDLHLLANEWLETVADDPNGDGIIDVRDLLYINTSGCN